MQRIWWRRSVAEKSWYGLSPSKACWASEREVSYAELQAELKSAELLRY